MILVFFDHSFRAFMMNAHTPKAPAPKRQPWGENHGQGARTSRSWLSKTWKNSGPPLDFHVWLESTVYSGIALQSTVAGWDASWSAGNQDWWQQEVAWNDEGYDEMGHSEQAIPNQHVSQSSSSSQAVNPPPAEQGWAQMPMSVAGATTKKKPRPWRGLSRHLE